MKDITNLYQIRLPDKDYIETYDMGELEHLMSEFLVGHQIEAILAKFDHFHYAESLDDVDEEMVDADNWLGFEALLELDHGYLELSPWVGETVQLRFFGKDELSVM